MTALATEENGAAPADAAAGWNVDKNGKFYAPARGRGGKVFREGEETLEQAYERDAKIKRDPPPKSKSKSRVPKAPPPTQKSLQELEFLLVELLRSPQMVTAATGDVWATAHFDREAPVLARNLCQAAEHNPWLRRKLEAFIAADDILLLKLLALAPCVAAAVAYVLPPIIYYLDPGFIPAGAREMFKVPERPTKPPVADGPEAEDAGAPQPAASDSAVPVGA